jgi:hypothetical protein
LEGIGKAIETIQKTFVDIFIWKRLADLGFKGWDLSLI